MEKGASSTQPDQQVGVEILDFAFIANIVSVGILYIEYPLRNSTKNRAWGRDFLYKRNNRIIPILHVQGQFSAHFPSPSLTHSH